MNGIIVLWWIIAFHGTVSSIVAPHAKPMGSDTPSTRHRSHNRRHRHRTTAAEKRFLRQMEEYEHQRDLYRQQVSDAQARRYEQYFEGMMEYGAQVQAERYRTLLRRQEMEREAMAKNLKQYGLHPSDIAPQTTEESTRDVEAEPVSPFGNLRPLPNAKQKPKEGTSHAEAEGERPALSVVPPGSENGELDQKVLALRKLCMRFLPTVRKHCVGERTAKEYVKRCEGYFHDCQSFLPRSDPLYSIAHAFSSNVRLNLGTGGANGIPYYPINEEGSISGGRTLNVPFGSWGGGFADHFGIRDYWSQTSEIGANWYDGKYGRRFVWSAPLVQSLGIEGDVHEFVSVPIKPGELGKPIAVDIGFGVGPYYQQNQHVGVDWMNGQVGTGFGLGVPFAGVGYKTGSGVVFPSVSTFAGHP
ncbi:hypothetical protein GCK32_000332 [Trichostrongylus colubriformis]|uniref:Uncharacterized protein n=1 Tax=Trichostrongylus colubriformis TaxID=6319 RepID=A0AAN8FVI3_TRICO